MVTLMKLSLSGFLFEDDRTTQSVSFDRFCHIARSAGYTGIELRRTQVNPDTPAAQRKQVLGLARDHGLDVTCLTARGLPPASPERDDFFRRYLDLCRDLQCPLLKIGGHADWLTHAAGLAQAAGVTLATNNHIGSPLETVEGTRNHFARINHPNMALLYDSMHLHIAGQDYLSCIDEFRPVTGNILVHSLRPAQGDEPASLEKNGKRWTAALPDDPHVQNWPAIFAQFKRLGYDGLITVIEAGWPRNQRERVAQHCATVITNLWTKGNPP